MIGVADGPVNGNEMTVVVEGGGEMVDGARWNGNGRGRQVGGCGAWERRGGADERMCGSSAGGSGR